MLFNSWLFVLVFLPSFLLAYQRAAKRNLDNDGPAYTLLAFSGIFYLFWGWQYFTLFAALLGMNYAFGTAIYRATERSRKSILAVAIICNLLPLAWFKYSWFIAENISLLLNADWRFTPPGLPLGISFYTFIQIAWLIGLYLGQFALPRVLDHLVFSTGFAWVVSGPIIRYDQTSALRQLTALKPIDLAPGLTLFGLGLAKKCLLADSLGPYADKIFDAAEKNWPLTCLEAWLGSLCYTFQLYFDFSGYTDMALGLCLMYGLKLPQNFNSPYKSTGIIEFWRRWHMTLGAWLRDFLYIPLGGSRKGSLRKYGNLFATMVIAGLWHGAGWTFILWGTLHGIMLVINHLFRSLTHGSRLDPLLKTPPCIWASITITFFSVSVCWVVFRAFSLDGALTMLNAMFALPGSPSANLAYLQIPGRLIASWLPFGLVAVSACICLLMPNSDQILSGKAGILAWRPSRPWALAAAALIFFSLAMLERQSAFLYFRF